MSSNLFINLHKYMYITILDVVFISGICFVVLRFTDIGVCNVYNVVCVYPSSQFE